MSDPCSRREAHRAIRSQLMDISVDPNVGPSRNDKDELFLKTFSVRQRASMPVRQIYMVHAHAFEVEVLAEVHVFRDDEGLAVIDRILGKGACGDDVLGVGTKTYFFQRHNPPISALSPTTNQGGIFQNTSRRKQPNASAKSTGKRIALVQTGL